MPARSLAPAVFLVLAACSAAVPGYTPPPAPAPGEPAAPGRGGGRGGNIAPSMTTIVRGRINARHEWVDQQVIFRAPANLYTTDGTHFGSRFIFDRDGHLFFSIGERGVMQNAQDLSNPLGGEGTSAFGNGYSGEQSPSDREPLWEPDRPLDPAPRQSTGRTDPRLAPQTGRLMNLDVKV